MYVSFNVYQNINIKTSILKTIKVKVFKVFYYN